MYRERRSEEFRSFAPVKVGEELDVKIEAVGEKGDGIAKKEGFVLFVPNVKEGDEVKIRVTKVLRKVGFAEVVGAGSPKAAAEGTEAPQEEAEEKEETPQDTEDFGEEPEAAEPESEKSEPEAEAEPEAELEEEIPEPTPEEETSN